MVQPVYLVIVSTECDDSYYPDYDDVYCVCSTKEKAEKIVDKLFAEYKSARVVEYRLDEIPEELNDD